MAGMTEAKAKALRAGFDAKQIGKLPKLVSKQDTEKYGCKPGTKASADGHYCGGYHARSVHLDYVGHAATTQRLLEVDPEWSWRPFTQEEVLALPPVMRDAGLWIMLTVCGVSRPGFGDTGGKSGGNAVKEAIGDAIRNGAMRFGVALDLWSKEDLHSDEQERGQEPTPAEAAAQAVQQDLHAAKAELWAVWQTDQDSGKDGLRAAYEEHTAQPLADATAEDLRAFLKHLRGEAA